MGDRIKTEDGKTWAECAKLCDDNTACFEFSYHAETNKCYLQKESSGPSYFKKGFVHSRRCGTTNFNCPKTECRTCPATGYTTEHSYYSGSNLKTLTKLNSEAECVAECDKEVDCVAVLYTKSNKYCYLRGTVTGNPVRNAVYSFHRR